MIRTMVWAWIVAGTLDILSAFVFAGMAGASPPQILRFVASGPFGNGMYTHPAGVPLGLATHFAIMLAMVAAYIFIAPHLGIAMRHPIVAGLAYGLLLWIVMQWLVVPLRWPAQWPLALWAGKDAGHVIWQISHQLFSHCVLVGIPIAWFTARAARAQV